MKLNSARARVLAIRVAPRRGAWIETNLSPACNRQSRRRTPQGCVD